MAVHGFGGGGPFGQGNNPFGGNQSQSSFVGSGFGNAPQTAPRFSPSGGGGGFGGFGAAPTFGTSTGGSPFGGGGTSFGAGQQQSPFAAAGAGGGGGAFGGGGGGFAGNVSGQFGQGGFAQSKPAFGAGSGFASNAGGGFSGGAGGLFGAGGGGGFGGGGGGAGMFGSQSSQGTKETRYQPKSEQDGTNASTVKMRSICAMDAYKGKSVEELRLEDYKIGNMGGSAGSTTAPFGQQAGAGGFGQQNSSPFGGAQGGAFGGGTGGATSSFGFSSAGGFGMGGGGFASSPAFGGQQRNMLGGNQASFGQSSPLFGQPGGAFGQQTQQQPQQGSSPFGGNPNFAGAPGQGLGGFGGGQGGLFGSSGGAGGFGSPQGGMGGFGQGQQQPQQQQPPQGGGFGFFGNTGPGFAQPGAGGGGFGAFGSHGQQQQGGLFSSSSGFGQSATGTAFGGGFGQQQGQPGAMGAGQGGQGASGSAFGGGFGQQQGQPGAGGVGQGLFGSTPAFGGNQGGGLFGGQPQSAPSFSSGSSPSPLGFSGGAQFGQQGSSSFFTGSQPQMGQSFSMGSFSGGMFGSQPASQPQSALFSFSQPQQQSSSSSLFAGGGMQSTFSPGGGAFSQPSIFGGGSFGQSTPLFPQTQQQQQQHQEQQQQPQANAQVSQQSPFGDLPSLPTTTSMGQPTVGSQFTASRAVNPMSRSRRPMTPRSGMRMGSRRGTGSQLYATSSGSGSPTHSESTEKSPALTPRSDPRRLFLREGLKSPLEMMRESERMQRDEREDRQDGKEQRKIATEDHGSNANNEVQEKMRTPKREATPNEDAKDAPTPVPVPNHAREETPGSAQDGHPSVERKKRQPENVLPKLRRPDYYTRPSLGQLAERARANPEALQSVDNFTVGRRHFGEIVWDGKTDIQGLDLDKLVLIEHAKVEVYSDDQQKPPPGQELNKSCEVRLFNVFKVDSRTKRPTTDAKKIEEFRRRLQNQEGTQFVNYDEGTGEWRFRVDHFSRFGLSESELVESEDEADHWLQLAQDASPPEKAHESEELALRAPARANLSAEEVAATRDAIFPRRQRHESEKDSPLVSSGSHHKSMQKASVQRPMIRQRFPIIDQRAEVMCKESIGQTAFAQDAEVEAQTLDSALSSLGTDCGLSNAGMFRAGWCVGGRVCFPVKGEPSLRPGTKVCVKQIFPMTDAQVSLAKSHHYVNAFENFSNLHVQDGETKAPLQRSLRISEDNLEDLCDSLKECCERVKNEYDEANMEDRKQDEAFEDEESVWELVATMYGKAQEEWPENLQRKRGVSFWLAQQAARNMDKPRSVVRSGSDMLSYAAEFSIKTLSAEAVNVRDMPKLAAIIAAGCGTEECRERAASFLQIYEKHCMLGRIPQDVRDVFSLLAGRVRDVKPIKGRFMWCSSLGFEIWYRRMPAASLSDALESYESDFRSGEALPPMPRHHERNNISNQPLTNVHDAAYLLLKAWSRQQQTADAIFLPQAFSADALDGSMPWLVMQLLYGLRKSGQTTDVVMESNSGDLSSDRTEARVTREFIDQLLRLVTVHEQREERGQTDGFNAFGHPAGVWYATHERSEHSSELAFSSRNAALLILKVALYLNGDSTRGQLCRKLLELLCPFLMDFPDVERMLSDEGLPVSWILNAEALFARYLDDESKELKYLRRLITEQGIEDAGADVVERANKLAIEKAIGTKALLGNPHDVAAALYDYAWAGEYSRLARAITRFSQGAKHGLRDVLEQAWSALSQLQADDWNTPGDPSRFTMVLLPFWSRAALSNISQGATLSDRQVSTHGEPFPRHDELLEDEIEAIAASLH